VRLFVSVDLPADLATALARAQRPLREAPGVRLVDPDRAHVTLRFLGDVPDDRLGAVERAVGDAVAAAGVGPFDATVGGLGVFPSLDRVRVVWAGLREGGDRLVCLHEAVEREAVALGIDPADHEFTPHVTLARTDDARATAPIREVVTTTDPTVGTFRVEAVDLTESRLDADGPRYRTVARHPLADRGSG
jgi:2'-5' RNA ligase